MRLWLQQSPFIWFNGDQLIRIHIFVLSTQDCDGKCPNGDNEKWKVLTASYATLTAHKWYSIFCSLLWSSKYVPSILLVWEQSLVCLPMCPQWTFRIEIIKQWEKSDKIWPCKTFAFQSSLNENSSVFLTEGQILICLWVLNTCLTLQGPLFLLQWLPSMIIFYLVWWMTFSLHKEKAREVPESLKMCNKFTFSCKDRICNYISRSRWPPGPLVSVRARGHKYSHRIQLVKEKVREAKYIVHKPVFVYLSALFFFCIQR